jgi:hypothetical protein
MRISKLLPFLLIGLVVLTAPSCSQTEIAQLQGQWELFNVNHLEDPNIYVWNFTGEDQLIITSYPAPTDSVPNPPSSIIGVGKYTTSAEFLDAVVVISEMVTTESAVYVQTSNCCSGENTGAWTILVIDDEVLRIGTADAGGYVIREFTRVR